MHKREFLVDCSPLFIGSNPEPSHKCRFHSCQPMDIISHMTLFEQKLQECEIRPAIFDDAEQIRRASMFQHFSAINRFEGITPNAVDERLFQLLSAGKISKQEYIEFCLMDARGAVE